MWKMLPCACSAASKSELESNLTKIVRSSSRWQTLKGLITAGPIKSMDYVVEKFKKAKK